MAAKKIALITGSSGLIGSEAVKFFCKKGFLVIGVDNDMRSYFFGKEASTIWNKKFLKKTFKKNYIHVDADIRNEKAMVRLFKKYRFDLIIHAAGQPSHDWAAREPLTDFTVNALGTMILLEACRKYVPDAVFIFISSNKVYGDRPNSLPLVELETRYELPKSHKYYKGVDEQMNIDNCTHSILGGSKMAADVMVQEYGRYFGLKTTVFRGGCLTGSGHSSAPLHGFLAYLVRCIKTGEPYTILGYKGKQVRDNIHSFDVVNTFYQVYLKPGIGEVYNLGGGRFSNVSILEAIAKIEAKVGKKAIVQYKKGNRRGDHIWYISDMSKFKEHYPKWDYTYTIDMIIDELCRSGH